VIFFWWVCGKIIKPSVHQHVKTIHWENNLKIKQYVVIYIIITV